jgi:hypothetical protein
MRCTLMAFLVCITLGMQQNLLASVVTVPSGLNPGDQYRLAFVTSFADQATSSNIADYNIFVTNVAHGVSQLSALGTTWTAIVSTQTVDARDNTGTNPSSTGVPIYTLGGPLIATNNADLWDGSISNPISISETGSAPTFGVTVWSGTQANGTRQSTEYLGVSPAGSKATYGDNSSTSSTWIAVTSNDHFNTDFYLLYAISGTLTVPTSVPEPASLCVWIGLACCAAAGARRMPKRGISGGGCQAN